MALLPPPAAVYPTRDDLLTAASNWAADHGYAVTIASSYEGKLYLKCDCGGSYRNRHNLTESVRRRNVGT